jgi:hypothetical protein
VNESDKVVQFLNVFNRPLRTKLKEMGVNDSDYPFSKRIVVEKVIKLTDGRLKQISYKYNA